MELTSEARVLIPRTSEYPRCGEGGAVVLEDGTVLFVYSRFTGGGADHSRAELFGGVLDPVEGSFGDGRVFFPDPDALNQMSVSLERLHDGTIGMVWLRKTAPDRDDIFFSTSRDEGKTWSDPVKVNSGDPAVYFVVNNDRLRQFSSGRLAIPVARNMAEGTCGRPEIALYYSDDGGATWSLSASACVGPDMPAAPHRLLPAQQTVWEKAVAAPACQEPGVEELADGRVLLYCRTIMGYMYRAYSSDNGGSWSDLEAAVDIVSPLSPQSIRRLPDSERLICVYNDRSAVPYGDEEGHWSWRTPLNLAISDDHGASWHTVAELEDESHNYCYTSICFAHEAALLTYYESFNELVDGEERRRNLSALKLWQVELAQLYADVADVGI